MINAVVMSDNEEFYFFEYEEPKPKLRSCMRTGLRPQHKVTFLEPEVGGISECKWTWEDIQQYWKEVELQKTPKKDLRSRRNEAKAKWIATATVIMRYYYEFLHHPLGVPNNPYHRDTAVTVRELKHLVDGLELLLLVVLDVAPPVFRYVHPFSPGLVAYFNAISGTFRQLRPPINVRRSTRLHKTHVIGGGSYYDRFIEPNVYMPLELRRRLAVYRLEMVKQWYCREKRKVGEVNIDFHRMVEDMREMGVKYVEDPMGYWEDPGREDLETEDEDMEMEDLEIQDREIEDQDL